MLTLTLCIMNQSSNNLWSIDETRISILLYLNLSYVIYFCYNLDNFLRFAFQFFFLTLHIISSSVHLMTSFIYRIYVWFFFISTLSFMVAWFFNIAFLSPFFYLFNYIKLQLQSLSDFFLCYFKFLGWLIFWPAASDLSVMTSFFLS